MPDTSIFSFSASAEGSPDIRGFIFGENEMRKYLVTCCLTHPSNPAISDLRVILQVIDGRFKSVATFLAESAPPAEGGCVQGSRLRVDTMNASGATPKKSSGRKPKGPGSAVSGGHHQPRQNAGVSMPPPALQAHCHRRHRCRPPPPTPWLPAWPAAEEERGPSPLPRCCTRAMARQAARAVRARSARIRRAVTGLAPQSLPVTSSRLGVTRL